MTMDPAELRNTHVDALRGLVERTCSTLVSWITDESGPGLPSLAAAGPDLINISDFLLL